MNVSVIRRGFRACLLAGLLCVAGHSPGESSSSPDIPIESWLQGPSRQDFPWRIEIGDAWLTFQQRRYVQARITFRVPDLVKAGISLRNLYFVVKVSGEDGHWLPGESNIRFEAPSGPAGPDEIHSLVNLLLRQGKYQVAVIGYDTLNRRGNVWRGPLQVGPLKDDPLPGIDRSLPKVEFLPAALVLRHAKDRKPSSLMTLDPWALGQGELLLPVTTERPVQVDIVANVSLSVATDQHNSEAPDWAYQLNGATLVQISNVLSQLNLKSGCVRFSAIDVRRQRIFADRENAHDLDWSRLRKEILSVNRNKIEAEILARQKHQPAFLAHYLELLADGPNLCHTSGPRPLHVVVLVSDAFLFANGAKMTTIQTTRIPVDLCYHLRLVPVAGMRWDQIGSVVKPLHPVRVDLSDSARFRKILAQLISGIESRSKNSAPQ